MAKPKRYRVVADVGVVGFNGVIHAPGEIISSDKVPAAHLKAWLHFKQIAELAPDSENEESPAPNETKPKGKK
jgi:hypothetical protein